MHTWPVTVLTILIVFDSLAWILGVLPTLQYALSHRTLPTLGGIRLLSGPFEALGIESLIVAGLVFVVVSALKLLAAYWIWHVRIDGAVLELILLGLSAIFWYGFALPFGPLGGVAVLVLLALAWKSLTEPVASPDASFHIPYTRDHSQCSRSDYDNREFLDVFDWLGGFGNRGHGPFGFGFHHPVLHYWPTFRHAQ